MTPSKRLRATALVCGTAVVGAFLLSACSTPLDRAYGRSHRDHLAAMIEEPDAAADQPETVRPDGASTGQAAAKFRKAEAKDQRDEQKGSTIINVGGQ